jgi:hypothetical protein
MNRNPILPNWQLPRRRPFGAHRGIALLQAWRLHLAEQPAPPVTSAHFPIVGTFCCRVRVLTRKFLGLLALRTAATTAAHKLKSHASKCSSNSDNSPKQSEHCRASVSKKTKHCDHLNRDFFDSQKIESLVGKDGVGNQTMAFRLSDLGY